jgi:putative methyltransferase (TIGR04325 family)
VSAAVSPRVWARRWLDGSLARHALRHRREHRFLSDAGFCAYYGVFESFAEARAWLPPSREFNNEAVAADFTEHRTAQIFAYDYPMLWWLERALRGGARRVLDIGGSVGVHYLAYRRYLEMPADLTWLVAELPKTALLGRELAAQRQAPALHFTDDMAHALQQPSDVWLSAGAIQYVEHGRPDQLLRRASTRPRHLLLNKLPLYPGEDYVTTQNIGWGSFSPLYVCNDARFIADIEALGYTLADRWDVPERSLYLPGDSARKVPCFSGLYFVDAGEAMNAGSRPR